MQIPVVFTCSLNKLCRAVQDCDGFEGRCSTSEDDFLQTNHWELGNSHSPFISLGQTVNNLLRIPNLYIPGVSKLDLVNVCV